ncbi:MAG: hypothetical protein C0469_16505 [Cyanobacteria bacterium DS2.3.42]|nr:hypothetical protein [Cyanobacteria bacterium DS2.3.42]
MAATISIVSLSDHLLGIIFNLEQFLEANKIDTMSGKAAHQYLTTWRATDHSKQCVRLEEASA